MEVGSVCQQLGLAVPVAGGERDDNSCRSCVAVGLESFGDLVGSP